MVAMKQYCLTGMFSMAKHVICMSVKEPFEMNRIEKRLTHVLTHTGISASGQGSTKWTFDLRDCLTSGHKSAGKHRIARDFRLDSSS